MLVTGSTRAMALDLGPDVRVNTVNPGWVVIERTEADLDDAERAHLESIHPVGCLGDPRRGGRCGLPRERRPAYVTDTNLMVDGGQYAVMRDETLPPYRK